MTFIVTVGAVEPVISCVIVPAAFGSCAVVFDICAAVFGFKMVFKARLAYALVIAGASRIFNKLCTAGFTAHFIVFRAGFALVYDMEAISAFHTKMVFIIGVFNAHSVVAFAVFFTAINAKLADFTLRSVAEGNAAVFADVFKPIGAFNTVFTAGAAFCFCILSAAVGAEVAVLAEVYAFFIEAGAALVADNAFVFTMISCACVKAVINSLKAAVAFGAVCVNAFLAVFTKSAVIADVSAAGTHMTEPAKRIRIAVVAFIAFKAMVLFAKHTAFTAVTLRTEYSFICKAGAAVLTVRFNIAVCVGFLRTDSAFLAKPVAPSFVTAQWAGDRVFSFACKRAERLKRRNG